MTPRGLPKVPIDWPHIIYDLILPALLGAVFGCLVGYLFAKSALAGAG